MIQFALKERSLKVLPKDCVPKLEEHIHTLDVQLAPVCDNPDAQNQLTQFLRQMLIALKDYGKRKLSPEEKRDLDGVWQVMLGQYPIQYITKAFYLYARTNEEFPAPANIIEILEDSHELYEYRKSLRDRKKLIDLRKLALNPPPPPPTEEELAAQRAEEARNRKELAESLKKLRKESEEKEAKERITNTVRALRKEGQPEEVVDEFLQSVNVSKEEYDAHYA